MGVFGHIPLCSTKVKNVRRVLNSEEGVKSLIGFNPSPNEPSEKAGLEALLNRQGISNFGNEMNSLWLLVLNFRV
jgi:hypothetical protein